MVRSNASQNIARLLAVTVTVAVVATLHLAKVVLLPLALAMLFAFLLAPLVTLLERIRLPRVLAIVLVILSFGTALGMIGWTVVGQLIEVTDNLPNYRTNIAEKIAVFHDGRPTKFTRAQHEVEHLSAQLGIAPPNSGRSHRTAGLGTSPERPVAVQEVGPSKFGMDSISGYLEPLEYLLLIIVFTFFMLLEREDLRNRLIRLTGGNRLNAMTQAMNDASQRVSRYFSLQLLVNVCYGSVIFGALHLIGLPHAMLWGALAGLLRFVPYIGAPFAALLPTLLSMAVFRGWEHTFMVMALFFVVEVFTANFLEPRLYGRHTGLSPLAILVVAVFWTLIWGPIGLILSVPLTVCLVVVGAHVPNLEFLTVLLGDQPVMPPEAHYYQRLLAGDEHEAAQVLEQYLETQPLPELYDAVVLPALALSEQDRHRNALDDATVSFINQTTRELVDELAVHADKLPAGGEPEMETKVQERPAGGALRIACVPVRDEADQIVALMLAQLLERAGYRAEALQNREADRVPEEIARIQPDLVVLSALPPYAVAHARGLYRRLRAAQPQLGIMVGLWNYPGEILKAAQEITGGEQQLVVTTLTQAVAEAGQPAGTAAGRLETAAPLELRPASA